MDSRIMRIAVLSTAALMVVGAAGTWATASVPGETVTVGGTAGGRDGAVVIVCAVCLAAAAVVQLRAVIVVGLLAALAATAISLYDVVDINDTDPFRVGWGLWLALVASIVAVLDAVMLIVARRATAPA